MFWVTFEWHFEIKMFWVTLQIWEICSLITLNLILWYIFNEPHFSVGSLSIYIIFISSSSSSCCVISADILDPVLPPLPIVYFFWQVFRATSRISTELLYIGLSWSSCLYSSMWRGPLEYITYELVPTSLAVSCMSGLSNFDSLHDGW